MTAICDIAFKSNHIKHCATGKGDYKLVYFFHRSILEIKRSNDIYNKLVNIIDYRFEYSI